MKEVEASLNQIGENTESLLECSFGPERTSMPGPALDLTIQAERSLQCCSCHPHQDMPCCQTNITGVALRSPDAQVRVPPAG